MSTVPTPTTKKCRPLPEDIRRIVRSGIVITSINQCVEELVLNSIDAGAANVYIKVNFHSFSLEVEDDGCGISKDDLEIVGTRFTTSKCNSFADLSNMKFYGFRGESLASLIDVSSAVSITSKSVDNKGDHLVYVKSFKDVTAVRPTTDLLRHGKGTLIRIHNVLGLFPVRQRRINKALQLEEIKKTLEYVCLINPRLSLILINGADSTPILSVPAKNSVKESFGEIFCKTSELIKYSRTMIEEHHQFSSFFFTACISSELYHNKDLQIVFINKRFLGRGKIHRNLNRLISNVLESKTKKKIEKRRTETVGFDSGNSFPSESKKCPVFVVNIICPFNEYDIILHSQKSEVEFCNWESVLKGCEGLALRFKAIIQSLSKYPVKDRVLHDAFPLVQSTLEADADGFGTKITTHDVRRALHSKIAVRQDNSVNTNVTFTKQNSTSGNKDKDSDSLNVLRTNIPLTQATQEPATMLKLVRCRPVGINNLKRHHQTDKCRVVAKQFKAASNPYPSPKLTGHIINGFTAFHNGQQGRSAPRQKKTNDEDLPNNWQASQEWSNHLQSLAVSVRNDKGPNTSKDYECSITKNIPPSPKLSPYSRGIWRVQLWQNENLAAEAYRTEFSRDSSQDSDINNNTNTTPRNECISDDYFRTANREIETALYMLGNTDSRIKIKNDCKKILTSTKIGLATWNSIKHLRKS